MVYQIASYQHWSAHFGRDDFEYGQFGENFTVDGLPDDEVCIGDRYAIGDALFEVSQPRVTCYRVGLRMGEPRMPALLVAHRRPGLLPAGAAGGTVQAGDPMVEGAAGPEAMTVAEVDALLYLPGHDRRDIDPRPADPGAEPGLAGLVRGRCWRPTGAPAATSASIGDRRAAAGLAGLPADQGGRRAPGERHASSRSGWPLRTGSRCRPPCPVSSWPSGCAGRRRRRRDPELLAVRRRPARPTTGSA